MKHLLADSDLEKLSAYIADKMGLWFPTSKWKTLEQAFSTATKELGFKDIQECITHFRAPSPSKEHIEIMAGYLTIGETYFFREARCFEILEHQIIPQIIKKRRGGERRLRIWCAGCASGEEPYSVAILLHRMRDALRGWEISILATDINPGSLRKARDAVYTSWSFRTSPAGFKEYYFRQTDDKHYELLPQIREMVTFSGMNLADECYPSPVTATEAIDVIFCRNVLMYFTPQLAAKVVERFKRCLLDDGWLFVSPCETSNPFFSGFEPVNYTDAILYHKTNAKKPAQPESAFRDTRPTPRIPNPAQPAYPACDISMTAAQPVTPVTITPSPLPHSIPAKHDKSADEQKAQKLFEQGAYQDAAEMAGLRLKRDKNDTAALALLCRIYANQGRLDEALKTSDLAIAADKLSAGLHYLRAVILQEQGLYDEAAVSLKKALYLDQDMILAHFTLANLEQRKGKLKESQRHFNTALALLDNYRPDEIIPESDGVFAERLREIIKATTART